MTLTQDQSALAAPGGASTRISRVRHSSIYRYDRPVALGPHYVRLHPAPEAAERVSGYALNISPTPYALHWQQDPHGNRIARVLFDGRTTELRLDVMVDVDMTPLNPFNFFVEPAADAWPLRYTPETWIELRSSLGWEPVGPRLAAFIDPYRAPMTFPGVIPALAAINREIHRTIQYIDRPTGEVQPSEETLAVGSGSCRDVAWLMVEALRALGCAARFVSGYLLPLAGFTHYPGTPGAGLHAWASIFIPGAGWVGLDPTSGTLCGEAYLPLLSTSHYAAAAPLTGTAELAAVDVAFHFEATPLSID